MNTHPNAMLFPDPARSAQQTQDNQSPMFLETGLTKREYFAGQFASGFAAAGSTGMPTPEFLAQYITDAADALIIELNKDKP